jgi:hypothetical protein
MYQVATDTQRESGPKASQPVSAINDDSQSEAEEDEEADDEVAAFLNKWNNRFQNGSKTQSQGQPQCNNQYNSGSGNNRNWNGKYCFYCKIQNHTQEECRKRIRENKQDKQGRAYWPKVYVTNENQERDQQGQQPVFH